MRVALLALAWALGLGSGLASATGRAAPPVEPPTAPGLPLSPAWLFLAEAPSETGPSRVSPIDALVLAPSAELYLRPIALVLQPRDAPAADEHGVVRFQVLARVVRADGGVTEWPVGAATTAPRGEGGRNLRLAPDGAPTLVDLGPARLGPVRTASVAALEFVVSLLPAPQEAGARAVGGLALEAAPAPGASDPDARARAAATIREAGGYPVLAVRIGVIEQGAPVPGRERQRLVVAVGPDSLGPTSGYELLMPTEEAPQALRGRDGEALAQIQALILDVEVVIPDHGPRSGGRQEPAGAQRGD
ncbi:MAG: hypothetical protein H6746_07885 [Deltaproteobacteria bacterium]|nr:hypothetical protein [Deltaproteobacteria bacterium]